MAEQEQVSGIGLGLSLDTAGFSAGIARAKAELAGLEATPVRVRAEVAVPREAIKVPVTPVFGIGRQELAGFRAQIEEGMKATGGQINVGVKLTRINFGALRSEIAAGIGTVPIKISVANAGKSSALSLVAATVAEQGGGETQSATAFVKNAAAKRGIPTRQYGGPVAPRRTVMVGESGPELAEFGGPVQIHSAHSARTAMWRGGRAEAYRNTLANQGGTFDPSGHQPGRGYAVASASGTAYRVPADDRVGFARGFRAVQRMGSRFVGTWMHNGEIDIDPAEVATRRREANLIARRNAQIAYFDLGRFEEIETERRRGDPSPGQMSFGMARGGRVPNEDLRRVARQYTRSIGLPDPTEGVYHPLDADFSRRTARAYEAMPTQANAASTRSYKAFVGETMAQWRMLRANGYGMTPQKIDPYAPAGGKTKMQLAAEDVRRNKNLNVFASYLEHPMMTPREQLIFRHVHDLMGHLAEGNSIGPRGEYNAAIQHSQMYSPLARRAMLAETHGQNSVVNFSDTVLPGRSRSIAAINAESPGSIYAEQKARNLPERILREFYAKAGIKRATGGPVKRRYIVRDPDGIHGRPSQYLAGLMEGLDVHIAARNLADRDRASFEGRGNETLDWYYLNARKGHGIEVTATGADAKRAHARIKGIMGFDPYAAQNKAYNPADRASGFADFDPSIGAAYRRNFHELKKLESGGFAEGFFDIAPKPQSKTARGEKVRSMANEGMTMAEFLRTASPEDKDFVDNLERAHQRLQPHHIEGGNAWYRVAGEYGRKIADKYGVDQRTGVGVLAALSAGTEWEANKTKYEKILAAHAAGKPFPYSDNFDAHKKAKAILGGQDPSEAFASSPKVGQFFPGMMGDLSTLTIDRWALRTATRGKLSQIGEGPVRTKIEQAWRQVADKYGMAPAVSQAALWLLEKEESGRAPGQGTMGFAGGGFAYASEASALARLRQLTDKSGTIHPKYVAEAQDLNLQIERMRMAARNPVVPQWAQRMHDNQGRPKEFRRRGGPASPGQASMFYRPGPAPKPFCTVCNHAVMNSFDHRFTKEHQRNLYPVVHDKTEGRMFYARMRQAFEGDQGTPEQNAWAGLHMEDPDFHSLARSLGSTPPRMRSEDEAHWAGRAAGGHVGRYIVGERGPELFVPKRMESLIPQDVMQRLPKREQGGIVEIGKKPFSEWTPPEDGWVIPNHLRNRIPGRARGGTVSPGQESFDFGEAPLHGPEWEGLHARVTPRAAASTTPIPVEIKKISAPTYTPSPHLFGGAVDPRTAGATRRYIEPAPRMGTGEHHFTLPSERAPTSDDIRGYLEGGPQLIQGRSSVRSTLAGLSSYVLGGRRGSAEQRHVANVAIGNLASAEREREGIRGRRAGIAEKIDEKQDKLDFAISRGRGADETAKAFDKRLAKMGEGVEELRIKHARLGVTEEDLTKKITNLSDTAEKAARVARVRPPNVLQNVASIALATTGYGLLTQGISAATAAAMPALEKWVDEMTGFKSTTTRVTSALADDTAARHGNAQAAIAGAAATAGLSSASLSFVDAILRPTVEAKDGAKAQGQTSDLFRATMGTGTGAPQGLYGGYGGLGGSAILGEFMGGGKGYTEQVMGDLSKLGATSRGDSRTVFGLPAKEDPLAGLLGLTTNPTPREQGGATVARQRYIDDQNSAMRRGANYAVEMASNLKLSADVTDDQVAAFAGTAKAAGDAETATNAMAAHVALIDAATGKVVTSVEDYQKFWEQAARGKGLADSDTVMRQIAQSMNATFAGIDARVTRALDVTMPAQTAMSLISNPLVSPSKFLPTGGFRNAGVTGTAQGNITASLGVSTVAQADIAGEAARGQTAMRNEVAQNSPAQLGTFNRELASAQMYSAQIASITGRISLEQANLSAHEFGQTMFYLNRQLSDAKGLAGEISGPNNLGSLQRSAFMIGRQQTGLGLDLQQRGITTQVALAGFQAPGESPEERYARREEAQIKARTQQKQLNLSRQAFGVEGQIFNVQATRGVQDTQRSIGLTQEQHNVALDTAAANKAIDDAGRALAIHLGKAGAIFDGAGQKVEAKLGAAVDFAAQYGGTMQAATASLNAAMKELADPKTGLQHTIEQLIAGATPTGGGGSGGGAPGAGGSGGGFASGILGMTQGPTHMYVGEAGRETVAILRNPRAAQMGFGGGGGGITIMVTGNSFGSPGDDQKLAQTIEAAVLSAMARKGQLLGLRGPSN